MAPKGSRSRAATAFCARAACIGQPTPATEPIRQSQQIMISTDRQFSCAASRAAFLPSIQSIASLQSRWLLQMDLASGRWIQPEQNIQPATTGATSRTTSQLLVVAHSADLIAHLGNVGHFLHRLGSPGRGHIQLTSDNVPSLATL